MTATGGLFDPSDRPIYFRAQQGDGRGPQDPAGLLPTTGGLFDPNDRPIYFRASGQNANWEPASETKPSTGGLFDPNDRPVYFRATSTQPGKHYDPCVESQTGGAFDPAGRPIYFTASDAKSQDIGVGHHTYVLVAVNELNASGERLLETWLDNGATVFLDSGIFNLTNDHVRAHPGLSMDDALALPPDAIDGFDQLFSRYVELVKRHGDRLWGYIELDQGGMEHKRRTRARLEDMGLRPVPVYHPFNDGWDYFDELAESYDRLCFGNVVQADRTQRKRLVATAWERHRRYPNLWIHLLGLTPNEWLLGMPIDSADSSAWLSSVRWSGYKETAALRALGGLPRDFQYELASEADGDTGSRKAVMMSTVGCKAMQRNWRNHLSAMAHHLELPMYPPHDPAEPRLRASHG